MRPREPKDLADQAIEPVSRHSAPRPDLAAWLGRTNEVTRIFLSAAHGPDMINLAGGLPDPAVFPAAELAGMAARAVSSHPAEVLGYGPIDGLPALRDRLAERFSGEGLRLRRENVLVTTAGMQALDLLGKVLLEPGSLVAAHAPTYLGAIDAWRPREPRFRPFSPDAGDAGFAAIFAGAQFAYAVPNFSNPTGRLVTLAQRRAMVEAAHATGVWLVEDDPYGSLYYEGEPLPRLLSLSAARAGEAAGDGYRGPVIYTGTFSKEVAPGLRIGWIVAAPEMIEALTLAKQGSDMCTSGLTQRLALDALESGMVERLRPTVVALYRERRDVLCRAMDDVLAPLFTWAKPAGGMFVWAVARDPDFDTDALMREALKAGVCITPSSVFDVEGRNRRAMRLNFTFNAPERLREGVRRLSLAAATLQR